MTLNPNRPPLVVGVTGGRVYRHREVVRLVLDTLAPTLVRHGACSSGADRFASDWCREHDVAEDRHPAHWSQHGKAAGPYRHGTMAKLAADLWVAFPGGPGTANMVRQADVAGHRVVRIPRGSFLTADAHPIFAELRPAPPRFL